MMGRFSNYVFGGPTSPMAGDGYGFNPSTPKSPGKSPIKSPSIMPGDCFGSGESRASASTRPGEPSSTSSQQEAARAEHGSSQISSRYLGGLCAPRCSTAIVPRVGNSLQSPRPGAETYGIASDSSVTNEALKVPEVILWQKYEIPQELGLMEDNMPSEIRNIVQESLDEHQAMRASLLQIPSVLFENAMEHLGVPPNGHELVTAESSAMASARSSAESFYSARSLSVPIRASPSVESDVENTGQINSSPSEATNQPLANSTQANSRATPGSNTETTEMEGRLMGDKMRSKKMYSLPKLLSTGRSKGETSPSMLSAELTMSECISCFDDIPEKKGVKLPCRHDYCKLCFEQLVSTSIQHEINFPPKCCLTDIPKKTIRDNLQPAACAAFDAKALEYAVPVADRYYCVSSSCGKWIDTRHAKRTNGTIKCPYCSVKLCTLCRGPQHPLNEDCPQDSSLNRTLEQAERAGWRRCYRCKAMVELNTGCRHITCKCRAEFCYTCGAKWRTCACTEADQYHRNEQIRTRLAQFEADQRVVEQRARRAEEERARAATATVESAERRLREEREAEDARMEQDIRELARKESERVQQITGYFHYLRGVLQRVQSQQRSAIERRHDKEWAVIDGMRKELDSPEVATRRESEVKTERHKIEASTKTTLKGLQRQHAASMMETITRHRKEQDELLARNTESDGQDAEAIKAESLQDLTATQDLERATLRSQQANEVQKWKSRGEASLQAFDSRMIAVKMRLEEAKKISKREKEIRDNIFADGKWTESLFEVRYTMLAEDEKRLVRNGGEVPAVPKREKAVLSGKESSILRLETQ